MKRIVFTILLTGCNLLLIAQTGKEFRSPDSFFPGKKTNVLLVGSFHFDYPGLDAHKTEDKDKVDVLTEPKKGELTALVDYIKKFKPTKIAIEAFPGWNATEKLNEFKAGKLRDKRDERIQLGLRIASEMHLDTIYSIDANSYDDELVKLDSNYFRDLFKDFDFENADPFNDLYKKWYGYEDKLPARMKLLDYFKRMNSRRSHQLGYGAYLVGDFKLDDQRGADILSIWWYNRNLRIFRKLQGITSSPEDRILVLFGNGHAAVLRQLIESSPEYKFIEFDSL